MIAPFTPFSKPETCESFTTLSVLPFSCLGHHQTSWFLFQHVSWTHSCLSKSTGSNFSIQLSIISSLGVCSGLPTSLPASSLASNNPICSCSLSSPLTPHSRPFMWPLTSPQPTRSQAWSSSPHQPRLVLPVSSFQSIHKTASGLLGLSFTWFLTGFILSVLGLLSSLAYTFLSQKGFPSPQLHSSPTCYSLPTQTIAGFVVTYSQPSSYSITSLIQLFSDQKCPEKNRIYSQVPVAHACNPSNLGGWDHLGRIWKYRKKPYSGHPVPLSVVLTFLGFSHCGQPWPQTLTVKSGILKEKGRERMFVTFITTSCDHCSTLLELISVFNL
jgi:hypothetical protein